MGCDIHFYVERRIDGAWRSVDEVVKDEDGCVSVPYQKLYYSGRCYDLFAILANVRNGGGFVPIHALRGVPSDADSVYAALVERWSGDGHSHSWATLAELLAYDWTQTARHVGWVNVGEWARWCVDGKPRSWSGGVGGGGVVHVTPEQMLAAWERVRAANGWPEVRQPTAHLRSTMLGQPSADETTRQMIKELTGRADASPYCEVSWVEPYYGSTGGFWSTTMPRLLALGRPEDVRVLYFFDN